jgi:hypothetical protein
MNRDFNVIEAARSGPRNLPRYSCAGREPLDPPSTYGSTTWCLKNTLFWSTIDIAALPCSDCMNT